MYKKLHLPLIEALPGKLFPDVAPQTVLSLADAALQDTIEFPVLRLVEPELPPAA